LLRSFVNLQEVDPGFATSGITTVSLSLPSSRYGSDPQRLTFFRELQERLSGRTEIQSVAATTNLPLSGSAMSFGFSIDGRPEVSFEEQLVAEYHVVTPGYFRTMGIRLLSGRDLNWQDDSEGSQVVVINQTFAERYWPNEDPLGESINLVSRGGPVSREVIGVVDDVRHAGLGSEPKVEVYVPLGQDAWEFTNFVVRATGELPVAELVRTEVAAMDAGLPLGVVVPIEQVVGRWLAPLRFQMVLVGLFAVTALGLAALGIYSVISYVVSLRTNEIGVRLALGAHSGRVFGSVVGQGLLIAAAGILLGVATALWMTKYLAGLLFEVSPKDPLVFVVAPVIVIAVAVLGSALPARRAVKVDPVEALREV
jgi:predicted permease